MERQQPELPEIPEFYHDAYGRRWQVGEWSMLSKYDPSIVFRPVKAVINGSEVKLWRSEERIRAEMKEAHDVGAPGRVGLLVVQM